MAKVNSELFSTRFNENTRKRKRKEKSEKVVRIKEGIKWKDEDWIELCPGNNLLLGIGGSRLLAKSENRDTILK